MQVVEGVDHSIGMWAHGAPLAVVVAVAVLLGLRHATDPDHLAAVTSLIAGDGRQRVRRAGLLGVCWGAGHATTLAFFGLPVVLFGASPPGAVRAGAEVAIGVVVLALGVRLLRRWRRGLFHVHVHRHADGTVHRHVHGHRGEERHEHAHVPPRSPLAAFSIGLLHGVGGSAGVGVLLLASIADRTLAAACLAVFAACTALSMAALSTGIGYVLASRHLSGAFERLVPVLGAGALVFGAWYAAAAVLTVPGL